jgi:hypothetical protein
MTRVFLFLFSGLIFSVTGCQRQVDIPIPPTNSGFIENSFGVSTARVFGIDFEIDATSGGVNSSTHIDANFFEPKKSLAKKVLRSVMIVPLNLPLSMNRPSTLGFRRKSSVCFGLAIE